MKILCKSLAVILAALMLFSAMAVTAAAAAPADGTYYVAGPTELCGDNWKADSEANKMDGEDGVFTKTYTALAAGDYQFKITNGKWSNEEGGADWGNGTSNYKFKVTEACDVTITFNTDDESIAVTGDKVETANEIKIESIALVGETDLCGDGWNPAYTANIMTEKDGVWTLTLNNVEAGEYEYKFAANGSWDVNWGASKEEGTDNEALSGEAAFEGDSLTLNFTGDVKDVTFKLDLSKYDPSTKKGATYEVTLSDVAEETTAPQETIATPDEATTAPEETTEAPEDTTAPVEEDTTVPETPVTPGFYVVGSEEVCGVEWAYDVPWKYNEPMKLSADGETYYQVFENVKASAGNDTDEGPDIYVFKVVYIDDKGYIDGKGYFTMHPGGIGNNTRVTVAEDGSTVLFQFKLLASRPTKEGTDPEAVIATVYGPKDEKPSDFSKVPYPEELEDTTAAPDEEETTFAPATEEKTPESITVEDMELTEGLDSYAATDDKTGKLYNRYDLCPKYTLHYSDGSTDEREYDPDNNDGIIYFETNQSIDNEWTPGEYKVKAYYGELETEFNVKINPSPVESVEFEPVSLVEGLDLSKKYIYDDDDNVIDSYYSYDYNLEYKVKFKNDSFTLGRDDDEFYYQGGYYKLSYNDGQSKDNQWKAGDHKIDAIVLGFKTSFTVSIKENPIEKVTVNDISIIKGAYDYYPDFTVTLKDGSEIKSFNGGIKLDDEYYDMYVEDGQYDNPWEKTGTYKAKGSFCGKYYEFNVNIIESPVKEVKTAALELIEGGDGYYDSDYDGEFVYSLRVPDFTVVLNNGEELKPDEYNCVYYNGTKYNAWINDGPYNWKVGETHKAQFSIMGQDVDFDVKVVSSPVEKIEIEPIVLIEGADVYYQENDPIYRVTSYDYDGDRYYDCITKLKCKITLKDGQVLESNEFDEIVYNGRTYRIRNNSDFVQNNVSPWTVGNSYDFNVYVLGKSAKATVKVVPTPVEKIIVLSDVQVKLNEDGAWRNVLVPSKYNGDGTWSNIPDSQPIIYHPERYFEYDTPAPELKVILKDGTELTSKNIKKNESGSGDVDDDVDDIVYYIEYNGTYYGIMFNDDQSYDNQWGLGEHEAELNVLGTTQKFKVNVKEELDPVVTPTNPTATDPVVTEPSNNNNTTVKQDNPIKVTAKKKAVKAKKLKKKAQKIKPLKVKNAKGKVSYKLVKGKISKKIRKLVKINSKGVITIKRWKKAKKGNYKIRVKITAKGNSMYKSKSVSKTVKIRIK